MRVIVPGIAPATAGELAAALEPMGWALKVVDATQNRLLEPSESLPMYASLWAYALNGPDAAAFAEQASLEALEAFAVDRDYLVSDVALAVQVDKRRKRVVYHLDLDGVNGEFQGTVASAIQTFDGAEIDLDI